MALAWTRNFFQPCHVYGSDRIITSPPFRTIVRAIGINMMQLITIFLFHWLQQKHDCGILLCI